MEINVDMKVSDYWNIQLDLGKKMNQEQRGKKKKNPTDKSRNLYWLWIYKIPTNSKTLISHIEWPINSKTTTFVIREI